MRQVYANRALASGRPQQPVWINRQRGRWYGNPYRADEKRHQQRYKQNQLPCRDQNVRIGYSQRRQSQPDHRSQHHRTDRCFQDYWEHYFLARFAAAIFTASMSNCSLPSILASTIPTSTSAIEPSQNQSAMRWTALAATRPRSWTARKT